MKKCVNLIFIFMLAVVFSPLQSSAHCHVEKKADDCHSCHDEHHESESDKKESEKEHDQSDCPMACCHMALGETNTIVLNQVEIKSFHIEVPWHTSGAINNYSSQLLRPPIA